MLLIKNLNQYYGSSHTLRNVNFTVEKKDCTVIMGRNGVGKTTLVQTLMGLLPSSSGEVLFNDQSILSTQAHDRAKMKIAYVPQGRKIFPLLSVKENLKIGLPISGKKTISDFVFELFPVLKSMINRLGGDLSGGQQQQLAIARALLIEPELLILDEPTEGIQPNIVEQICQVIKQLNHDWGLTVLLVEQKLPIAKSVADKFVILDRGISVAQGCMQNLDQHTIKKYLTV